VAWLSGSTCWSAFRKRAADQIVRSATQFFRKTFLLDPERIRDFEAALAAYAETDDGEPYVRGNLFCFEDHVLFLIFDEAKESPHSAQASSTTLKRLSPSENWTHSAGELHELLPQ